MKNTNHLFVAVLLFLTASLFFTWTALSPPALAGCCQFSSGTCVSTDNLTECSSSGGTFKAAQICVSGEVCVVPFDFNEFLTGIDRQIKDLFDLEIQARKKIEDVVARGTDEGELAKAKDLLAEAKELNQRIIESIRLETNRDAFIVFPIGGEERTLVSNVLDILEQVRKPDKSAKQILAAAIKHVKKQGGVVDEGTKGNLEGAIERIEEATDLKVMALCRIQEF